MSIKTFVNTLSALKSVIADSSRGLLRLSRRARGVPCDPEYLWIEATRRCNCKCVFCNIWCTPSSAAELTPEKIEEALSDRLFRKLKVVVVSGGEPTLRTDLTELMAAIHRAVPKAGMVISSNGTLPERLIETIKALLTGNTPISAGISLDGIAAHHDRTRGVSGLFDKIDTMLGELAILKKRHGGLLNVAVGYTLSDSTVDDMDAVRRYVEKFGFSFNVQWYNQAEYYGNVNNDQLSRKHIIEQNTKMLPPNVMRDAGLAWLRGKPVNFRCFAMYNFLILKSNGDIVPCFSMWDSTIGNIRANVPSHIWRSDAAKKSRTRVKCCPGCLNACGVVWSAESGYFPKIAFNLRHLDILRKKLG